MKNLLFTALLLCIGALAAAAVDIDYSKYGAGPMVKPGRTFYVSLKGNDKNDGRQLKTAFRTIKRGAAELKAGDTLLIEGGEYFEREIQLNVKEKSKGFSGQCGIPGSPIRIMGMKGHKVVLRGTDMLPLGKKEGTIYKFRYSSRLIYNTVQEYPSGIELQRVYDEKLVREYPGTFFYDQAKKLLLVNPVSLDQTHISPAVRRIGIRIHGSYIHIENIQFRSFYEAIYSRMNSPYEANHASHITIQNCTFFHNYKNGIVFQGASWSLVKNNSFHSNTNYGGIMTQRESHDNLFTENYFGYNEQTLRHERPHSYDFGYSNYGGMPPRNHIIANYFDTPVAFRWKAGCPGSVIRDNAILGSFYAESPAVPALITNNLITGKVGWMALGHGIWDKEFAPTPVKFYGNHRNKASFKASPSLLKAKSLAIRIPEVRFPAVTFKDLSARFTTADSTAVCWQTPGCDGWGEVLLYDAKEKYIRRYISEIQGARHTVGVTKLLPGREYRYRAAFRNRRGGKVTLSEMKSFKTPLKTRLPRILEVGPGRLTLTEAAAAAIPGDTVKLLPGTHQGQFNLLRSGAPGKPITLTGDKKAFLDAQKFHAPMIVLKNKHHVIVDGITFINPESTVRKGIIRAEGGSCVTIRNCHAPLFSYTAGPFVTLRNVPGSVVENNIIHGGDYPIATVGKNIKIRRNTIVDATMLTLSIWDPADLEIRDNIFFRPCIPQKRNQVMTLNSIKGKIISEGNVFWSPVKEHPVGGRIRDHRGYILKESKTLEEWQKISGLDKTSIHADPMFVDYAKGDFRLKPGSPAKNKGARL